MLSLVEKPGFLIERDMDHAEYRLTIDLSKPDSKNHPLFFLE